MVISCLTYLPLASSPGNMSPTTAQQTMSYAPPLLRLAGEFLTQALKMGISKSELMISSFTTRCPSSCYVLTGFQQHTDP